MSRIPLTVGTAVIAVTLALAAQAQTPAKKTDAVPSTAAKVEHWTKKKWDAAKREWQKDKAKWDACNQRATDQHLTGRKSWSYIYDCMKA